MFNVVGYVLILFIGFNFIHLNVSQGNFKYSLEIREKYCYNETNIINLQTKQMKEIRKILDSKDTSHDDFNFWKNLAERFYTDSYKLIYINQSTYLDINSKEHNINSNKAIVFIDIFKNANLNMQYYLCNYKYFSLNHPQTCKRQIYHGDMSCNLDISYNVDFIDNPSFHPHMVYALVRNPISRALSGYAEIEWEGKKFARWDIFVNNSLHNRIEPKNTPGSIERVKETFQIVIRDIIPLVRGQEKFNHLKLRTSYQHLNPQIGSILNAFEKYQMKPNLYHLEDFDNEMKQFSIQSGLNDFYRAYEFCNKTNVITHPSSNDVLNSGVKRAMESFLSYASDDAFQQFGQKYGDKRIVVENSQLPEVKKEALDFLRMLCRLYLVDFICTDYDLPSDCKDLVNDL